MRSSTARGSGSIIGPADRARASALAAGRVDFCGSDFPLHEQKEWKRDWMHFPMCSGPVAVVYHLPGSGIGKPRGLAPGRGEGLRLSPFLLGEIFMGRIRSWGHPALRAANPGVDLPESLAITVLHRAEQSGTSHYFTRFLGRHHGGWQNRLGAGWEKSLGGRNFRWPVGYGVFGNAGMAAALNRIPGSLGYLDGTRALGPELRAVRLVLAAEETGMSGKEGAVAVGSPAAPPAAIGIESPDYPLQARTYLFLRRQAPPSPARERMPTLLRFMLEEIPGHAASLHYLPPPEAERKEALARIDSLEKSLKTDLLNGTALRIGKTGPSRAHRTGNPGPGPAPRSGNIP